MKCIIIYFSQLGSTELIAKTIQKGMLKFAHMFEGSDVKGLNHRNISQF